MNKDSRRQMETVDREDNDDRSLSTRNHIMIKTYKGNRYKIVQTKTYEMNGERRMKNEE